MIVDDHHAAAAILSFEVARSREPSQARPPVYLDARVPAIMHLRLVAALNKPSSGRLTRLLQSVDVAHRAAMIDVIASPRRGSVTVLDDRPLAAAIGVLTAEPGVSIAFAAMIAHAQAAGQPIVVDPANEGRWIATAEARHIDVVRLAAAVP